MDSASKYATYRHGQWGDGGAGSAQGRRACPAVGDQCSDECHAPEQDAVHDGFSLSSEMWLDKKRYGFQLN